MAERGTRHAGLVVEELVTPEGLVLRPWGPGDVGAVIEAFAPLDMSAQSAGPITTPEQALAWIEERAAAWESGEGFTWAVTGGGQVLGSVSVSVIDRAHESGWVSYFTLPAARGRGIASAALRAAAAWALGEVGLYRLELGHRVNNPASCAVATAAGFAAEGIERAKLRYGEQRFDVERHARLASDPPPPAPRQATTARGAPTTAGAPAHGLDGGPERGDAASWLSLELGVADHLRREGIDVGAPPGREGRDPLVLHAAWTLLPEAGVENLPPIARAEIAAGLGGPLRGAIAAAEAREGAVEALRDQLVAQVSGMDPQRGAIVVADQVHLRRLVRGEVPAIIALGCLAWYGAHRQPGDADAEAITALRELEQAWRHRPDQRPDLEAQIRTIAVDIVGEDPTTLIDDPL